MTIKKMLLLAVMALAAVAFAAPAAQANPQWLDEGTGEPIEGEREFSASGGITSEASGGAFQTGPGTVHFTGSLVNEEGAAHGEITGASITGPIATNLPGCQANSATTSASAKNPWTVSTGTPDSASISNVTFTNHYSEGCLKFGVPATVNAAGTVTATWENVNTTGSETGPKIHEVCLTLSKSGDLTNESNGQPVNLTSNGTGVCIPNITLG